MKYAMQYISAVTLFIFSTLVAWYEGSAIRNDPWEWKYTAYFSNKLNGEITNSSDISQKDYFIYAAKFSPVYPILIIVSLSYILMLSGFLLLKNHIKKLTVLYLSLGIIYMVLGISVADSPTVGGGYFTVTFLIGGMINVTLAILCFFKMKNGTRIIQ